MSTELTPYRTASLEEKRAYVQTLASAGDLIKKGLWANVKNHETGLMENRPSPGKIMLVVETGLMLGLHPMAALQGIDVIEGNPTLKPALMSALIRDAGHVLRIEQTGTIERGDLTVTVTGIRKDDPDYPYIYAWTPHDGIRAGLVDSYQPDENGVWHVRARSEKGNVKPWEAYTARMCRWRALGDVASAGFEDVLMGLHFTPEEMGATVNADGEVVDVTPDPEPSEDWASAIDACATKDEVSAVVERVKAADEYTDAVRTLVLTKIGNLSRAAEAIEAPKEQPAEAPAERDPAEPTPEEYEALEAATLDIPGATK